MSGKGQIDYLIKATAGVRPSACTQHRIQIITQSRIPSSGKQNTLRRDVQRRVWFMDSARGIFIHTAGIPADFAA